MNARQTRIFGFAGRFCLPKMAQKLRDFLMNLAQIPLKALLFVDDLLILGGISIIVWANFRVNELFGWYSLGFLSLALGIFLAWPAGKGRRK